MGDTNANFFLKPDKDQCKDAGMALVFGLLIVAVVWDLHKLVGWAIVALLLLMLWPKLFKPFAALWFGLSNVLGMVVPRILLTLLFFIMVVPVGAIRRLSGKDTLKLKQFKAGEDSVFRERQDTVQPGDLEQLF